MFLALAPLSFISEEFVGVIINTKTLKNNLTSYTKHEPINAEKKRTETAN